MRIRGDQGRSLEALVWLTAVVLVAAVERELLDTGREVTVEVGVERNAEKSKAGGSTKPETGLRLVGVQAVRKDWVEAGEDGSEPQQDVSKSARRQI